MPKQTFFNLKEEKSNKIIQAAVDEFSSKPYELVNLSDIIKKAEIPRGSFYQYFEDKKDIYLYLIDQIKKTKMDYLSKSMLNQDTPFLKLVEELYDSGIHFAINHPKFVLIMDKLIKNKNEIYDQMMKNNKNFAIDYYSKLINKDKAKGLIRDDIHTLTLAKIISDLTSNVTINELNVNNPEESYKVMKENIHHILNILKKGIEENV
ncbi:TetR/AcrR family transcriptional regulator [Mycoplasmatota bacterium]|nr:TetR/AcrR family transcriptional regulator [Mycoplasmatota bacterium]